MKKLLTIIAMAAICLQGFAKTADEVINDIKAETGAMVVNVNKDMMKSWFIDNAEDGKNISIEIKQVLDKINSGTIAILEDASSKKMEAFNKHTDELLADKSYESFASVLNNDNRVKIVGKNDNGHITELLIIVSEDKDGVFICMNCDLTKDDINVLINDKAINFGK